MDTNCVIFACSIFDTDRLHVLQEFLNCFEVHFLDCDFYVGINYNSVNSVESILNNSKLRIKGMKRCSKELYTESDASAYQIALDLCKSSHTNYSNFWFVHTKGAVNSHSDYLRTWYIANFLNNKSEIHDFLNKHTGIGSYGLLSLAFDYSKKYNETDTELPLFENVISCDLPATHSNFFYIHTMYTIKGDVINNFFKLASNAWFQSKLDRYYFEGIFPFIVSRSGFFPYVENSIDMNGVNLYHLNDDWITQNNLEKYREYLNLHKTNYKFDQFAPPYVNSNT